MKLWLLCTAVPWKLLFHTPYMLSTPALMVAFTVFAFSCYRDGAFADSLMDPPRQSQKANLNREPRRGQSQTSTPPQKDAYARLLSQHHSSKFSVYLEQYAKDLSFQREGNGPGPVLGVQSDGLNIQQQMRDQVPNDLDFSLSSAKNKGGESSLSLYMEKLSTRNAQQESERKQGVSDRQRHGQRRDTTTSQDGDIESGEELGSIKPNVAKKHQKPHKKNKDSSRDVASKEAELLAGLPQSPKKASSSEEKPKKSKKKVLPKHPDEEKNREGILKCGAETQMSRPKSPHGKDKNLQQPRSKLLVPFCSFFLFLLRESTHNNPLREVSESLSYVFFSFKCQFSCRQE